MSDPDEALQKAIADVCLGAGAGEAMAKDLRAFLESHGVAPDDVEAILAAPPRLAVYRTLVRNGIGKVVLDVLGGTHAHLHRRAPGRFEADLAAFADDVGPRTHYLRDVPGEFLAWAAPRWRSDAAVPAWLVDFATFELTAFAVATSAPARLPEAPVDVAIDLPLLFADSMRLLRCAWPVHELEDDESGANPSAQRDVCLLAYRDETHAVRWMELTPLAGAVLDRLAAGEPLGAAVERACAEHKTVPGAVLREVARLLADLGERGVLLGARGT
jgi:uncharacterized protein